MPKSVFDFLDYDDGTDVPWNNVLDQGPQLGEELEDADSDDE